MRLIDADELKMSIKMLAKDIARANGGVDDITLALKEAYDMVCDAPAVDAAPVVHGHYGFVGLGVRAVEIMFGTCSECRERIGWYSHNTYCPNCGAKMDGGNC